MTKVSIVYLPALLCAILFPVLLNAQDDVVHGSIEFEEDIKYKKTYQNTQDEVIEIMRLLSAFTTDPSREITAIEMELEQDHLLYLNALYLYCAVKKGSCQPVLDTILEIDVIDSRQNGTAKCKTMKRFWKSWIANDMEKRHQFQVKTGYLKETQDFRKKKLPRYLRCSDTVAEALATNSESTNLEYFTKRYNLPSVPRQAITDTLGLIEDARKSKTNLLFKAGTD